jgi:hypothetical protein
MLSHRQPRRLFPTEIKTAGARFGSYRSLTAWPAVCNLAVGQEDHAKA